MFSGRNFDVQTVIHQIQGLIADLYMVGQVCPHMKCNTDGALITSDRRSACGDVFRDDLCSVDGRALGNFDCTPISLG